MASNSSKFFRKILKTGLVTASGAAIMLSSSGALGAEINVTGNVVLFEEDGTNLSAVWFNTDSLKLTGAFDIATGQDELDVAGVDINGNAGQTFTVAHNSTKIGGALAMNLVLTGAAGNTTVRSVGAGNVSVAGGILNIGAADQAVTLTGGQVKQAGAVGGALDVSGGGIYEGTVAANVGGTVNVQADAGAVTINNATGDVVVAGGTLNLVGAAADMTITGGTVNQTGTIGENLNVSGSGKLIGDAAATDVTGTVTLQADATGVVTIKNATGAVDIAGGTLNLVAAADGMTITGGTVNQTGAITGGLGVSGGGKLIGTAATNVDGLVNVQADAGAVVINNATKSVIVAGSTLSIVNAAANMTIKGGTVNQTGTIGGNLNVSGSGKLIGDAAATDVTGTVTLQASAGNVAIRNALNVAAVSVAGGTLNIHNAVGGINFVAGAGVGTTVTVAADGNVNDVKNTTGDNGIGILTFAGARQAGIIGDDNSLAAVNVGAGEVTISGAVVKANAINLTDAGGASSIIFADKAQVTGVILNTSGTNQKGIVTFKASAGGNSSITGGIGNNTAAGAIGSLNANVDNGQSLTIGGDVYTQNLNFNDAAAAGDAAGTVQIAGNLIADNVNFTADNNGGILEFNGNDNKGYPDGYLFKGAVQNGNNATLTVNAFLLTTTDASIGTVKTININNNKIFLLGASAADVTLLDNGAKINFVGPNSTFGLTNDVNKAANRTVTLKATLDPGDVNKGRAILLGPDITLDLVDQKTLTVQSDTGAEKLGGDVNKLAALGVGGAVTISGVAGKQLNIQNTQRLDVFGGAVLTDQSGSSANIPMINIGTAYAELDVEAGPATHIIDVSTAAAVNLQGGNIKFADAGSIFKIQNTVAGDKTVTLADNIVGGVAGVAGPGGIVELNADVVEGVSKLIIAGGKTLGTEANQLQTISFTGNGEVDLTPNGGTKFYAKNLNLGVTAIKLGAIAQHLEFSGNTTLTATGDVASVNFKGNNATINMNDGVNITGAVTNTGVATNNGTIEFKVSGYIGGNISGLAMLKAGAGAVELKTGGATVITEIQGTGTSTLTLPENFKLTGAINLTGGQAVKLNFKGGTNSISGVVGTATNPVGGITTAGTTTFTSAVNSKGPITTAGNTTFSNSLNNIGDVTTSGTTIFTGAYTNTGTATFGGTTSFVDKFNNNGAVILAPGSINNFAKNVTATSFVASAATMNFGNSLAFNSSLTGSGTTINLGSGQLAYTGQASFTDTLTLNSNFDGETNSGGNILITGANSKMDLSGVTKLKLVISTTNFDANNINPNTKYTLILAQDGGSLTELSSADIIETTIGNQENQFLKWTLNPSSLVLTASNISDDALQEGLDEGDLEDAPADVKESIRILIRAPKDSEAGKFKTNLGFIEDNEVLVDKVIDSLEADVVRTGDAVAAINTQATSGTITSAITSLSSRMNNLQVANNQAAVAAGEEDEAKFGIWATPFVGNSTQKMRNNVNGNKSNFSGATVGFDGMLNDNLVLGVAYTRADSKIKQKNDKIGDKSKVNSNIYSIYGLYNLPTNNLFFEAVGSYGDSRVKNYTQHLLPTARNTITSQIAHGKYKSRSYTGQVMVGYDYVTAQANLTPMVGIRYSNIKDAGYTETGTTLQNLIVKGKKYNIVEGLAGAKVSTNVNVDQVILTPELYGLINYGFKNKAPAIDARLQGMDAPFPTNSFKSPKTSYNLGAGVTAKYQMMEYGINYDVNIASKYFAQQGSLKVRVNF